MTKAVISQDEQSYTHDLSGRVGDNKSTVKQVTGIANLVATMSKNDASLALVLIQALKQRQADNAEYRKANPPKVTRERKQSLIAVQKTRLAEKGIPDTAIVALETQGFFDSAEAYDTIGAIMRGDEATKAKLLAKAG